MDKLRAVLDTNVIVSGLLTPTGTSARVLHHLEHDVFVLVSSVAIAVEVLDVLTRPKITRKYPVRDRLNEILALILNEKTLLVAGTSQVISLHDPDDEKFLAAAVEADAHYIVSGDRADLLSLDIYRNIPIVTVRQFLEVHDRQRLKT